MCGGKCGSTTLFSSFQNAGYRCLKVHSEKDYVKQFNSNSLYHTINISSLFKKIIIIDSYRLPIERKISSFFENIHIHVPNFKSLSIDRLITIFNNRYLKNIEEYHSINTVLNHYDAPLFKKFDFKNKYNKYEKNNKIFIKLLYKDINDWENILSKILKKKIKIVTTNLSMNKNYIDIYKKFKDNYKVPKSYIKILRTYDKEFRIYNTREEQRAYVQKWLQRSY